MTVGLLEMCSELETIIKDVYERGINYGEAEKLAARFLFAQMEISKELQDADLDARMRKNGVKTIRASLYLDICQKADKKPTEGTIEATLNADKIVCDEQTTADESEANRAALQRYYDIFANAHIFFRGASKGSF